MHNMFTSTGDNQQSTQLTKKIKYSLSGSIGYRSHIVLLTSMWIDSLNGKL